MTSLKSKGGDCNNARKNINLKLNQPFLVPTRGKFDKHPSSQSHILSSQHTIPQENNIWK